MARKKETKNILDMVPVRVYNWEDDETVLVKVPRFRGKVGQKFIDLVKKEQTWKIIMKMVLIYERPSIQRYFGALCAR